MAEQKKGLTLIELLLVVVVIGVLAALAVPRYSASKHKAMQAVMMADLRNAAIYQEQFAADNHGHYFAGNATHAAPLNGFTPSPGVEVVLTAFNDTVGGELASWTATARHGESSESCKTRSGTITCTTANALTTGTIPN